MKCNFCQKETEQAGTHEECVTKLEQFAATLQSLGFTVQIRENDLMLYFEGTMFYLPFNTTGIDGQRIDITKFSVSSILKSMHAHALIRGRIDGKEELKKKLLSL